jgi:hypothetical protein
MEPIFYKGRATSGSLHGVYQRSKACSVLCHCDSNNLNQISLVLTSNKRLWNSSSTVAVVTKKAYFEDITALWHKAKIRTSAKSLPRGLPYLSWHFLKRISESKKTQMKLTTINSVYNLSHREIIGKWRKGNTFHRKSLQNHQQPQIEEMYHAGGMQQNTSWFLHRLPHTLKKRESINYYNCSSNASHA